MASIQRRVNRDGKVSYRAQVRIRGYEPVGATFNRGQVTCKGSFERGSPESQPLPGL